MLQMSSNKLSAVDKFWMLNILCFSPFFFPTYCAPVSPSAPGAHGGQGVLEGFSPFKQDKNVAT